MKMGLTLANASVAPMAVGAPTLDSMGSQEPLIGHPVNPVVEAHTQQSFGTHKSRSFNKRSNPVHGMIASMIRKGT
jgi:hypothetical protein